MYTNNHLSYFLFTFLPGAFILLNQEIRYAANLSFNAVLESIAYSKKISVKEQADFIRKMLRRELPISSHAVEMTKMLLFKETLPGGWKLFGKTG